MTERLTTTSYTLLGLLSISPMSGYDLHQAVARSIAHFWPVSKTQVYAELARLEPLGLIEGTDVPQERLPDKRVFRLAPAGEEALDEWLSDSPVEAVQMRIPFLIKTLLGHRRSPKETRRLLEGVRAGAEGEAAKFAQFDELLAGAPDTAYARVTVLFGKKIAEAIASWAEEATGLLPEREHRIDPRRRAPKNAPELLLSGPDAARVGR
jgi:DNA-binding PadR family transcriptional regulator